MGYIILAACLVLAFIKPASKKVIPFILLYLWVLYALNYYMPDAVFYEHVYNTDAILYSFYYEPAYTLLMMACRALKLNFVWFRIVLGVLYTGGLYVVVRRYTEYVNYAATLFIIFPLSYFISVIRAGFAGLVVLYAISFLFREEKRPALKYILCIFVATLFHTASLLFLPLVFAAKPLKIKWVLAVACLLLIAVVMIVWTDIPYRIVCLVTSNDRVVGWFRVTDDGEPNLTGFVLMCAVVFGNLFLSKVVSLCLKTVPQSLCNVCTEKVGKMADVVVRINFLMVCLIPLLAVSSTFMRIIYQLFLMNICLCANVSGELAKLREDRMVRFLTTAAILGLVWTVMIMLYMNYPEMNTEGSMLLTYNFKYNWVELLFGR